MKLQRNSIDGWVVASVESPWIDNEHRGWTPCVKWCDKNVKESNWRYVGEGVFEFRRADDHMLFTLRWS
jgi:hypothetical protein